ncbi:MAG: antitoxin [Pseudonocardia sp.]|nr:antitoxin [Pseudonocardia sp.]
MPKLRNLAALAAAVEAGRRYARKNPDKAGNYVDQAAAFIDKQTKGKYSGQIHGVIGKVKSAAGLPPTTRAYDTNVGYGEHQGYGAAPAVPDPPTTTPPSTTQPSTTQPSTTPPARSTVDPEPTERNVPGSKDL